MDRAKKFGRNSMRFFNRLVNREAEREESLYFKTSIRQEQRFIVWVIENFALCPLKHGEYHQSSAFYTGFSSSTKWALRIYPRGKTTGKVGFYIYKMSPDARVAVDLYLDIKILDIEKEIKVLERKNFRMDSEEYGIETDLLSYKFLDKESVKIRCWLTVGYLDEADESCTAGSPLCSLSADLKEIHTSGKFSDVTLEVGKKQFPAHKSILSARSAVFAAMFDHPMAESHTNVVAIKDVEPSVFSDVLHYIYTGAVDNFTVDKAIALFEVADQYSLEELQKRCVRVMLAKLCVENVCQIAILADMHSEPKLKAAANYVFRKYTYQIFDKKDWKVLTNRRPLLATEIIQNVTTDFNTSCSDTCASRS